MPRSGGVGRPRSGARRGSTSPREDRPRERLHRHGARALTELELIALVLGHGGPGASASDLARSVLAATDGSVGTLGRVDAGELRGIPGIGDVGAARLVAAVELGKRVAAARREPGRPVAGPGDVWRLMRVELGDLAHEEFHVLLLNAQNAPLRSRLVTRGILDASLIHPREVFRDAIVQRAASLVLVHNHPSGHPEPSDEDLRVTHQLVRAGEELGIPVVDHVIVTASAYVSLAARGRLRADGAAQDVPWRVRDPVCSRRDACAVPAEAV